MSAAWAARSRRSRGPGAFGGRRKLAYEIGHHKEGIYVLEVIKGGGDLVRELDRRLKVTEGLLRHLIVRVDEDQLKAERARNKRQANRAAAASRAAAAGASAR